MTLTPRALAQRSAAAKARWKRWRDIAEAAEKGDEAAIEAMAAWDEAQALCRPQPSTAGLSRGKNGRYRLDQIPGESWGSRQGAHYALKKHLATPCPKRWEDGPHRWEAGAPGEPAWCYYCEVTRPVPPPNPQELRRAHRERIALEVAKLTASKL